MPPLAGTVLVTGASRGIGLGLTTQLLACPRVDRVVAAVRDPAAARPALVQLGGGDRLQVVQLDTASPQSIAGCVEELQRSGIDHLDLVVNNAGIMGSTASVGNLDQDAFLEAFTVNTVGPLLLAQALHTAGLVGGNGGATLVANISSVLGSIGSDDYNAWQLLPYRASKAALNALSKHLDLALAGDGVACVALHPGYVQTDINGGDGDVSVDESCRSMLEVLQRDAAELRGRFLNRWGEPLPW